MSTRSESRPALRPVLHPRRPADWYSRWGKRAFDLILGTAMLLVLLPLLLIVGLATAVFLGRPVFFRQRRPGRQGVIFPMVKFRSMTDRRGSDGALLPDAERITRFGSFLRASSLDELPELWNVLVGDMSLVGPRPLLIQYLDRYDDEQYRRHEVCPGITGWAQINGRNAISWDEKFAFDLWYVDHYSLAVDLKILILTVLRVVRRNDINADGHASMPEFQGNPEN